MPAILVQSIATKASNKALNWTPSAPVSLNVRTLRRIRKYRKDAIPSPKNIRQKTRKAEYFSSYIEIYRRMDG